MDIIKTNEDIPWYRKKQWLVLALIICGGWFVASFTSPKTHAVSSQQLLMAKVRQGDVIVSVNGYGELQSRDEKIITTPTTATVKEIMLKPGVPVSQESVIVVLENPELEQALQVTKQRLNKALANVRRVAVKHQREQLEEEARLSRLSSQLEAAKMRLKALDELSQKGIVSKLEHQDAQVSVQQLSVEISIYQKRLTALALLQKETLAVEQQTLNQLQGEYQNAQQKVAQLKVTAGFDGMLQNLYVELGQSLTPGARVAKVGSMDDLIALLQVPQNQASDLTIGLTSQISLRQQKISGQVTRIDPVIMDNRVTVEIDLIGQLPESARPYSAVKGKIEIQTLNDVTFIENPVGVLPNSRNSLYRVSPDGETALLTKLTFGAKSERVTIIEQGAAEDQTFIISDLSRLHDTVTALTIN